MSWLGVSTTLYFFSDGALRSEPPAASAAVVVKDAQNRVVDWYSYSLPPVTSCEAEYYGLMASIELALRLRPHIAIFYLDSQVVVGQVTGRYRVREERLRKLYSKASAALTKLREAKVKAELYYIPRKFNQLADALAADALLLPPSELSKLRFDRD